MRNPFPGGTLSARQFLALTPYLTLIVVGVTGYGLGSRRAFDPDGRATTVSRLSPDETTLARMVEVAANSSDDRRVRLNLRSLADSVTIFTSPEGGTGGPPGSERLIWSKDGTKLLLVGRHFFVKDDLFLDNGDQAFFLHDLPTRRGWCNSEAPVGLPALTAEMIEGIEFTEPVRLKIR